ncbi:MAG: hypothetical protein WCF81_11135 [Roseiarcus sp.]
MKLIGEQQALAGKFGVFVADPPTALNRDALDGEQQALKILANSTSYGIFVEINVADLDASEKLTCYGPDGEGFSVSSDKVEEPGRFFYPLLATLITGAARLMLGIAERLCVEKDLDWAFAIPTAWRSPSPTGCAKPNSFSVRNRFASGSRH